MIDQVGYLISEEFTEEINEIGERKKKTIEREVFLRISHVSFREISEASTIGEKPELRALVFFGDYNGETKIEIEQTVYRIYRTYFNEKTEKMELYVTRRLHDKES